MIKTFLLVDDSKLAREKVRSYLKELGFSEFFEASNGQDAIDQYLKYRPDVITLDIEMPVLNGIEVIKELRQISDTLKVVWITAQDNKHLILEAQGLCRSAFIKKPISQEQLSNAIKLISR